MQPRDRVKVGSSIRRDPRQKLACGCSRGCDRNPGVPCRRLLSGYDGPRRCRSLPTARRACHPSRTAVRGLECSARRDVLRVHPFCGLDHALRRVVGLAHAGPDRVRSSAVVPAHAGVRGSPRARAGAARGAAAVGRAGDRGGEPCRVADAPPADHVPDQGGGQQRAAPVPAHLLERHGDVHGAGRDPGHAPDRVGARAGGRAGRRGGRIASAGGDALLHVLSRRDRGGDHRRRPLHRRRAPARPAGGAARGGHPAGRRAEPRVRIRIVGAIQLLGRGRRGRRAARCSCG